MSCAPCGRPTMYLRYNFVTFIVLIVNKLNLKLNIYKKTGLLQDTIINKWTWWRNRVPPDILHHEIFDLKGKKEQGRKGKWRGKERKIWKGRGEKLKMEGKKVWKFACHFLKPLKFVWGLPKWTIFNRKNHISRWEKIGKIDFVPSEKYSSYYTVSNAWLKQTNKQTKNRTQHLCCLITES